jgi:hypothetical protein
MTEPPWIDAKEVGLLFGMNEKSVKNAITRGTFPIATYKLGRRRVADREVLAAFFAARKAEGFKQLANSTKS